MPLADGVGALAAAIRNKINEMMPRLLPSGGTTGQVLAKIDGTAFNVSWQTLAASGATITVFTDQAAFDAYTPAAGEIAVLDGDASTIGVPAGGAARQVLTKVDGTDYNTQWAKPVVGAHYLMPLPAGSVITQAVNGTTPVTVAGAALRCDWFPFIPGNDLSIDQFGVEVTTAVSGSSILLGIYDDLNGVPGNKLVESSSIAGTGVGGQVSPISPSLTMLAGRAYWLAVLWSSTTTLRALSSATVYSTSLVTVNGGPMTCRRATLASMALPATAPATTLTTASIPSFRMRVAA